MINDSIKFLVQSIEKSLVIQKHGCYYQSFQDILPENLLERLKKLEPTNCLVKKLEGQETFNRVRVDYQEDISKALNLIFKSSKIKNVFEEKYKMELVPQTTDIWFDSKGYNLTPHTDDSRLALSMQIYINTDSSIPGTALFKSKNSTESFCQFKYVENNGYSLLNNKTGYHGTAFEMKSSNVRKSVYVRYGKRT